MGREHLHLLFFYALNSELFHVRVGADLGIRKMPVLPEEYVESQAEDAESDEKYGSEKDFHYMMNSGLIG